MTDLILQAERLREQADQTLAELIALRKENAAGKAAGKAAIEELTAALKMSRGWLELAQEDYGRNAAPDIQTIDTLLTKYAPKENA